MANKVFEQALQFHEVHTTRGSVWFPVVRVGLIPHRGKPLTISLLFDMGASTTTLRHDFAQLLGATAWTEGEPVEVDTAGGQQKVKAYRFTTRLEVFGKVIECPVQLMQLPRSPYYQGLLGREVVFEHFGFGFWESSHELLVTTNP